MRVINVYYFYICYFLLDIENKSIRLKKKLDLGYALLDFYFILY